MAFACAHVTPVEAHALLTLFHPHPTRITRVVSRLGPRLEKHEEEVNQRVRYAEFRWRGLPIGSGPVETACKTIIKARLCRSGMRWSRPGGQAILALRTNLVRLGKDIG